ncbi:hypothetical protein DL93DRAFT_2226912 [Clavulina sp. PMI_390]|nr:hypothetical protein DL93DRAFT_2226912 [Clavulina sp. PMI_390]
MPGAAMAATKHNQFSKQHRNSSKLSLNSRSNSSSKLHQGNAPNFAFTALKAADVQTPKRVDSSQTIRTEKSVGGGHSSRERPNSRPALATRHSSRQGPQVAPKKPKFAMHADVQDARSAAADASSDSYEDVEDDDENWVSSGVATPDDREEAEPGHKTPHLRPPPELSAHNEPTPLVSRQPLPSHRDLIAGPSSVPTYDSNALEQRHADPEEEDEFDYRPRAGGYKTAPSSRPPSVHSRYGPGRPSLVRTASFAPVLNTAAPPLMTTSIANAQITSTNPPEVQEEVLTPPGIESPIHYRDSWGGTGPIRASPPDSPMSARMSQASQSQFLPSRTDASGSSTSHFRPGMVRMSTASSVATVPATRSYLVPNATNSGTEAMDALNHSGPRTRKTSTFSMASGTLGAVTSSVAGLFSRGSIPSVGSSLNPEAHHSPSHIHHPHHPRSAAISSLQANSKHREQPLQLTSHFPPESQLAHVKSGGMPGAGQIAFSLLPPPYMAAHMAVRTYEAPLQDAYTRVVVGRPRPTLGMTTK